tara:strand:+ start:413 stop:748 length:336 start_codon:yes stop_codon:yes gene_type:complete
MKIHYLWYVCITVRFLYIFAIRYLYKIKKELRMIICGILFIQGAGLIKNFIFGSNNEIQFSKVFWHETRLIHGSLYLLSSFYLFNKNLNMNSLILAIDLLFSFLYRFFMDK